MLCYHELGMEYRGDHRFSDQGEIGILLLELQRDFSLTDIEREVAFLDEALRNIRKSERAERTVTPEQDTSGNNRPVRYPLAAVSLFPPEKERAGFR